MEMKRQRNREKERESEIEGRVQWKGHGETAPSHICSGTAYCGRALNGKKAKNLDTLVLLARAKCYEGTGTYLPTRTLRVPAYMCCTGNERGKSSTLNRAVEYERRLPSWYWGQSHEYVYKQCSSAECGLRVHDSPCSITRSWSSFNFASDFF